MSQVFVDPVAQSSAALTQAALSGRSNKRATVRYRCAPATIGRLYVSDDHEYQHSWLVNLSLGGVGLILTRPMPRGSFVMIHIKSNHPGRTYKLAAHVIYCNPLPHGEWNVGLELVTPLSPEDLDLLL